ncbi:MAG TPA: metalloregulator ArsR/SmtB family transcription factor [Candidatus Elarobacter sp.]|jgi:DNA-binding transcriptional ArsR family regulator
MTHGAIFDALGDPTRRAVFERLALGAASVGEIARTLPVSRPAVSQHLKVLAAARLVRSQAEGTRRVYELDAVGIESLRSYFERFWAGRLGAFKSAAESGRKEHR